MMKKTVLFLTAAAIAAAAVLLTSCSSEFSDEQIKSAAGELIGASYEVNEIFFGKGLPAADKTSDEAKDFENDNSVALDSVSYVPVDHNCGITKKSEVMEKAQSVYSASYCTYLEEIGFTGVSNEDTGDAVFARFIEDEGGYLTERSDLAEKGMTLSRTFDAESITVLKNTKREIRISAESYVNGEKDETIELVLVNENGSLRLDTPTY